MSADTKNPVRILCIVVETAEGAALVQDIFDKMDNQGSIRVIVPEELELAKKYMLIGDISEDSEGLKLIASSVYDVDTLDVKLYKETVKLEERVNRANHSP